MGLKPGSVHSLHRFRQMLWFPHQHSVIVHTRAVRFEQGTGLVLDHAVGKELDAVRGEQRMPELLNASSRLQHPGQRRGKVPRIGQ